MCFLTVLMLLYILVNCGRITLFVVVLVFFGHFDTENAPQFYTMIKILGFFEDHFLFPFFPIFPIFFFSLLSFVFFSNSLFFIFFYHFYSILLDFFISLLFCTFSPLLSSYFCQEFRVFTFNFSNTPITIKHT